MKSSTRALSVIARLTLRLTALVAHEQLIRNQVCEVLNARQFSRAQDWVTAQLASVQRQLSLFVSAENLRYLLTSAGAPAHMSLPANRPTLASHLVGAVMSQNWAVVRSVGFPAYWTHVLNARQAAAWDAKYAE
jgi:phytoene dehydrogenase-like protein